MKLYYNLKLNDINVLKVIANLKLFNELNIYKYVT